MRKPDWKTTLEEAARLAIAFLDSLPERPVFARESAHTMLAALDAPLPEQPTAPEEVVSALARDLDPGITAMPSGRFFGWVIGGALPAALAADWLTSTWDQNAASVAATPGVAAVEQVAARWVLEALDLPRKSAVGFVTGAQMANTVCLAAARNHVLAASGWDVEADGLAGAPPVEVIVGAERHDTVIKAVRLLGLGARRVRVVEADDHGRMRPDRLAEALAAAGPTIVCAQAGDIHTGGIDPLGAVADEVDRHRERTPGGAAWLHVDGAFGLWARAGGAALTAQAAGAERADSWATDAHKWLNTPYDCGIAITAHPEAHWRAMSIRAAYLPSPDAHALRTPSEYVPELSRRARGVAVYAALRQLGKSGVTDIVERCCEMARRFGDQLAAVDGVEVMNEVTLNQVVVRFRDPRGADDDLHTRQVVQRIGEDGTCLGSDTTWRGSAAMRISVSNWSTDEDDVDRSVAAIIRAHRAAA